MNELSHILTAHAQTYPLMRPQDAVKLIYQNEFGGGHLITDTTASLKRLRAEYTGVTHDPSVPLWEDIGNGLVRVMLTALDITQYPLETLNENFARSAALHTGNREVFAQKLDVLRELTRQGVFTFSPEELDAYLSDYMASGCPAVSHSEQYRAAYQPAYRVVLRRLLPPLPVLLHAIGQCAAPSDRPLLVAIDGRCASGKTTLAAQLQKTCGCGVVHMDDFFLRPEQRTQERLDAPGENVDHERFLSEVLLPLSRGEVSQYRPFDCSTQTLGELIQVEPSPVVIVEGSYSCHPALWPYYDLRVFLTISPEEQMRRIVAREGTEYAEVFRTKWIPLEERYFDAYPLADKCNHYFEQ